MCSCHMSSHPRKSRGRSMRSTSSWWAIVAPGGATLRISPTLCEPSSTSVVDGDGAFSTSLACPGGTSVSEHMLTVQCCASAGSTSTMDTLRWSIGTSTLRAPPLECRPEGNCARSSALVPLTPTAPVCSRHCDATVPNQQHCPCVSLVEAGHSDRPLLDAPRTVAVFHIGLLAQFTGGRLALPFGITPDSECHEGSGVFH
jgi:hypothetical protein